MSRAASLPLGGVHVQLHPLTSKTRNFNGTGGGRLRRVIVLMNVFFEAQAACQFIDVCLHVCLVDALRGGDKGKST